MPRYTAFPRMQPFNRECEFTVKRQITLAGTVLKFGDTVDKTLLTTRRLRQLYEQRFIVQGDLDRPALIAPHSIDFKQLPTAAIVSWLAARHKIPRPGSDRAKIISLAETIQAKEKEADNAVVSGNADKKRNLQRVQRPAADGDSAQSNV